MAELKLPSKLTSFEDVTRAFRDLEKNINTLHKAKSAAESETKETEGESGDIRATRNVDGTYTFEVRTKEGWKTPALGNSVIKFKDKPSTISQNIVKSIDDLQTDDTTTGANEAVKSIFDEKENQFSVKHLTGISRPDFDSGWIRYNQCDSNVDVDAATVISHTLGVLPTMIMVYFAPGQGSGSHGTAIDSSEITYFTTVEGNHIGSSSVGQARYGIAFKVTASAVLFTSGDANTGYWSNFNTGSAATAATTSNGCMRYLLWK